MSGSLLDKLVSSPVRPGSLVWIGLRPARGAAMQTPQCATLIAARGIEGDRFQTTRDGARQATLISEEALASIAAYLGRDRVGPELLRRNLVTRGINLAALKGRRFRVGGAILEYSGECAPCSQMEANLGPGGYNAVRGHGGITARIIEGGEVGIGDVVERVG
jgi:MOSC domain-containing protein YiiM